MKTNMRTTGTEWNWSTCRDWRERVCRLRSAGYAKYLDDFFVKGDESARDAAKLSLTSVILMANVRGMNPADMVQRDMPELAEWLGM